MKMITQTLDAVSAGNFKTGADGRTLYYPNGVIGHGYVVPDAATHERIRAGLRPNLLMLFAVIFVLSPLIGVVDTQYGIAAAFGLAAVALIAILIHARHARARLVAGLERAESKLTLGEAFRAQAKASPRWLQMVQVSVFSLILVGGILMIGDARSGFEMAQSLGAIAVGLIFLAASLYEIKVRANL